MHQEEMQKVEKSFAVLFRNLTLCQGRKNMKDELYKQHWEQWMKYNASA